MKSSASEQGLSIQLQKNLPTFDESGAPNDGFLLKFVSVRSS